MSNTWTKLFVLIRCKYVSYPKWNKSFVRSWTKLHKSICIPLFTSGNLHCERNTNANMTDNNVLIQNISRDEFADLVRQVIREEITPTLKAQEPPVKYRTRKEVCELLKVSLPTLDTYVRTGVIVGKRIGTRILFDEASVQAAVKVMPAVKHKRYIPSSVKPLV